MKPHCFPQREGRVVGFLSPLFFQSTKLSQPFCLGEVGAIVAHLLETVVAEEMFSESVSPPPEKGML